MKRTLIALIALMTLVGADALAGSRLRWPWQRQPKEVTLQKEVAEPEEDEIGEESGGREAHERRERAERARRVTAKIAAERKAGEIETPVGDPAQLKPVRISPPTERVMVKAKGRVFDVRTLPARRPRQRERPERQGPLPAPVIAQPAQEEDGARRVGTESFRPVSQVAAPAPIITFEGLDRFNWGAGSPPDTTGDTGPTYYIQSVNTSVGIYRKSDGFQEAAFTFDTLMSQGSFGNQCDTENFGDPVVLYDTFEDRWVLTDFAFTLDGGGNVSPAVAYQCFAVSQSGDPLAGGWNFYSITVTDGLNDYPKLGVWTDGIYMSANLFGFPAGGSFQGVRTWAFNKAQMYAGSPTVQVVSFDLGAGDFTVVPSNARLQTGTPPTGRPNLFVSSWNFTNALTVYKFHVDWDHISLSTFTGPDVPIAATSWPNAAVANAPQSGTATLLDVLQIRAMVQNQYTNFGGTESLWVPHTVRRAAGGFAAPRWYQVDVTGGTVAASVAQATTWDPDAANVMHRFMPSLALDRGGNLALGYSTSSSTTFPSIKYAGRLAGDPINTFSYTEQTLFTGTASQTGTSRWGDYSSMTLDPDGCTFWYTTEFANPLSQTFDQRWRTQIGAFRYPECTPVGAGGTVSGTVTALAGGAPLAGAAIQFGARSTTTNGSGFYSFSNIPAGTYPSISASVPGYVSQTVTGIVVTDGGTTTQDFALADAVDSACLTDTTQLDFEGGVGTNVDLTTISGDVILANPNVVDQQNLTVTTSGFGVNATSWAAQTFTAAISGNIKRVDLDLFCSGCTGTTPNLTVSIRATTGSPLLPTGADLGTATIPGFNTGAGGFFTANFATPVPIVSGTRYAIVLRPTSNPSAGTYAYVCSCTSPNSNPYPNGQRATSANSGGTWTADTTSGGRDLGFSVYVNNGFVAAGNLVSSMKDSNPSVGITPIWSTLSWNDTKPASTDVKFQAGASNSTNGPFNFVGPDGTGSTFFTSSGASLDQFYGSRYLRYKAILESSDNTATPALHDVTVCFDDVDCSGETAPITPGQSVVCAGSAGNTASGPAGASAYSWSIVNGTIQGSTISQSISYTAGASGTVDLMLTITAPSGCHVSNFVSVPIGVATPTVTPGGPTTFCTGGSVTLDSSSASGNQWYLDGNPIGGATNQQYVATAGGDYTVVVTVDGCDSSPSLATTVTVNPIPATPTITPDGATTFCDGGGVTLTSSSATGNQWYLDGNPIGGATDQDYVATASGDYTVVVTEIGCDSAPSSATTVTVNPTPATPTITPDGPTTFCDSDSVTLSSSSATGNQWYLDGNPIGGATNQDYIAGIAGDYQVVVTQLGCSGNPSSATTVTVNPIPATPTITPDGPTTFCDGDSVTLSSSAASGNQWYLDGNPIGGATNQDYVATVGGDYTVVVTELGCPSAPSSATTVTVNPAPPTPTITPGGPTTFCAGGSVTLTSSSASGNQWYVNGNPIGGATNQAYVASVAGDYTVVVTSSGCSSAPSSVTTVTVNPLPNATITAPAAVQTLSTGNAASVANAGGGATYAWSVTNGAITSGNGTPSILFTAGSVGSMSLDVTVTSGAGCSDSDSASITVTTLPVVTVTSVTPSSGTTFGGTNVTLAGTNFASGATVTFGGTAATNVVVVNATQITATTPAHAAGAVNVTVTNTNTSSGTLNNGYTYVQQIFDPNGDGEIDPSDIFYLVNYLFLGGPAPAGTAGYASGDANGDGVVDPADIFYLVNYLFGGGPAPAVREPGRPVTTARDASFSGALSLGTPVRRGSHWRVPVMLRMNEGSAVPNAIALRVLVGGAASNVSAHRAGTIGDPVFEISRRTDDSISYLVAFGERAPGRETTIAEIELDAAGAVTLGFDPALTMLVGADGVQKATAAAETLRLSGTTLTPADRSPRERTPNQN